MKKTKGLSPEMKDLVMQEVTSSYDHDEIRGFKNFQEFWDQVDTQNAYEEEWKAWKKKGIKFTYREVYYQLKKALQ